jgi:hypothetical protein
MHGNAAEWVLDQFEKQGYDKLRMSIASGKRPIHWPTSLHPRTVRGGSWDALPKECRSVSKLASSVEWQEDEAQIPQSPWWLACNTQRQVGFRIARPLLVPESKERARYWDADVKALEEAIETKITSDGRGRIGIVDLKLPVAIRSFDNE